VPGAVAGIKPSTPVLDPPKQPPGREQSKPSTPTAPPPKSTTAAATSAPQKVRVNCHNACMNGCLTNNSNALFFNGMCAPYLCAKERVTQDACSKHCAGTKQDYLRDAGDPIVAYCRKFP
jgi:hypothetical protein